MSLFQKIYQSKKTKARLGIIKTPHGEIETPAFIPVGTNASVKSLSPEELSQLEVQIFFANTYHLLLRPGPEVIQKAGGLHQFCGWKGPIITDSGGFQVFSLGQPHFRPKNQDELFGGKLVKIQDNGVLFRSPIDGKEIFLGPQESITIQHQLGADLIIAFDDCLPYPISKEKARRSLERTHRWAEISLRTHQKLNQQQKTPQFLYGVVQGSYFKNLREQSAKFIASLDFDGIAIGGVSVGEPKEKMRQVVDWIIPHLPSSKPRHLLGVGQIDDIFDFVERGIDTFDCVIPTRLARMGKFLAKKVAKPLDITKKRYKTDFSPLEKDCRCYTCRHFSRAYLHHLFKSKELLGYRLLTIHNLYFFTQLMKQIRQAIKENCLEELRHEYLKI